jgi:acyl carrier protein
MIDDPTPRLHAWIIANLLDGQAPAGFDDDTDLIADGIMDSLAIMTLVTHLEGSFGVQVVHGDIVPEHFQSVRAIAAYVGHASGPKGGAGDTGDDALEARGRALIAALPHVLAYPAADYVLAPYVNCTLRPNMDTGIIRTDALGFRVSHDAVGIIDSESWFARPRRALALGNSFTVGWCCSGDAATVPSLLSHATPYSFLNLGITGASSLQETIAAIPFLDQAELVLVISGVGNLMHYYEHGSEYDRYGAFFPQQLFLGAGQTRVDHLSTLLGRAADDPADPTRAALARHMAAHAKRPPSWGPSQLRERFHLAVRHHYRDLRLLARALNPGARLLYAMQPTASLAKPALEPDEQAMLAATRQLPMWQDVFEPFVRDRLAEYCAAIRDNCEALGVPYIDLDDLDYRGVCFVDYGHTTDTANGHIARRLAERLRDSPPTT